MSITLKARHLFDALFIAGLFTIGAMHGDKVLMFTTMAALSGEAMVASGPEDRHTAWQGVGALTAIGFGVYSVFRAMTHLG